MTPFDGTLPYFPEEPALACRHAPQAGDSPAGRKTILFAWELGGGLGHMLPMLPLVEGLARQGHSVYVALRELRRAADVFARAGVRFLQAPFAGSTPRFPRPAAYAQLLANVGFGDFAELFAHACAWRNLFKLVDPDLVLFDHAPTALLASRGLPMRRALLGSGFFNVPDTADESGVWAVLRPELARRIGPRPLLDQQQQVLDRVNKLLGKWRQPPIDRLGQLYSDVDENFLTTLPELDPFAGRRDGPGYFGYWGPSCSAAARSAPGEPPQWPAGRGRRVFAYLKRFEALGDLLAALRDSGCPTLVYLDRPAADDLGYESPTLRFARRRIDAAAAGRECDVAVHNAGHGLTAEMLLAGNPILEIPLNWEQRLNAQAVERLGAGAVASCRDPQAVRAGLDALLAGRFDAAAWTFARRYAALDPARQRASMQSSLVRLLDGLQSRKPPAECSAVIRPGFPADKPPSICAASAD